ncbi:hypothetical protein K504DRAFT_468797 [Pleomassaria siparia CBS 279.74]|uniref:Uncharacterized protein n=1 Tax=Pleomassaria siparia CBS 279.74 TaxID=1314801 RepID=A0A6G1K7L7_9PLEO|nr:hypothetical protein K504DRAFT_468797 [Pleomassaria siparia CBS 279.74]
MQFFAVVASLLAVASAQYSAAEESACGTVVVTVTVPYGHVPTGPASTGATIPPYPTGSAPYPSVVVPAASGTGVVVPPVVPAGTAAPSGTGVYTAPVPEFTGAASAVRVPAFAAGLVGLAAFVL